MTLTCDLWPWTFVWTLPWSLVITPENFMKIRWWEHSQKGVTDRQTDGRTDRQTENTIPRAAWSQRKTIGHLFYATSSFVHHFTIIAEFELELQSRDAYFGSKSTNYFSIVTSQFDVWPCKTMGHLFYASSSFVHHPVAIGEFKLELQSGNDQSGSNSTICFRRVTLKFVGWPRKTIGHLFYATSSLVHHFTIIGEFELELQSRNA